MERSPPDLICDSYSHYRVSGSEQVGGRLEFHDLSLAGVVTHKYLRAQPPKPTYRGYFVFMPMIIDETVHHSIALAKYRAALFRKSLSSSER